MRGACSSLPSTTLTCWRNLHRQQLYLCWGGVLHH
jgi:hypothetical protein